MHSRLALALSLAAALACGRDKTLTLTPSGTVDAAGPVTLTAGGDGLAEDAQWTLAGPGSLSSNRGRVVTYTPPAMVDLTAGATATVTVTSGGQSKSVTLKPKPAPSESAAIAGLKGAVDVTYDAQQIPHIFCTAIEDCLAVQGYVHAQDRLFQMDLFRRVARGRSAELMGALQVDSDTRLLTLFTTRDGKRIEDQLVGALDADTKAKIDAYAAGVNGYLAYLTAHPQLMPLEYGQLGMPLTPADIPAWTPQDSLAIGRLQQFQLSESLSKEIDAGLFALVYGPGGLKTDLAKFAAWFRSQQAVPGYTTSTSDLAAGRDEAAQASLQAAAAQIEATQPWRENLVRVASALDGLREGIGGFGPDAGSNNWVVAGTHTDTGKAMVANDPHLALNYPPLFHLAAMTAGDGSVLNLVGASFPGIPGALLGRGAKVAWGVTVVGYDVTDVYQETLTSCTGPAALPCTHVEYKGATVPISVVQVPLKVRSSSGVATQTATVLVVPHHGPIVDYNPNTKTAISFRWTGHEVTNDLRAFARLNVATAVGDKTAAPGTAFEALKDYAVGAQNFVLADTAGNIGYDPHALVPKRPWATGSTLLPWLPLPGKTGAAEWGSQSAGDNCAGTVTGGALPARACWIEDDKLPSAVNPAKGYLATANADPGGYGSNGDPVNNPGVPGAPYMSFDWGEGTGLRYVRIAELLKSKTANGGKVTLADMQAIQSDHVSKLGAVMLPLLPAAADAPADVKTSYTAALAMLNQWKTDGFDCPTGLSAVDTSSAPVTDAVQLRSSAACYLLHVFVRRMMESVLDDDFATVGRLTGRSVSYGSGDGIKALMYLLSLPAGDPRATFCNDVSSAGASTDRTCQNHAYVQLAGAYSALTTAYGASTNWIWGRAHTLTTRSPAAPLIAGAFAAGPFARPGGYLTVDVANPSRGTASAPLSFSYGNGSQVRMVAVMHDAAQAVVKMQLPGYEKDVPYGSLVRSPDLLRQWAQNQYFDFLVGHQVDMAAFGSQHFGP